MMAALYFAFKGYHTGGTIASRYVSFLKDW